MAADTAGVKGSNVFTRHIGPLPTWAWTAIVGAVVVGWAWWKNRQGGSSSSQPSSTADASQVPPFVNQVYTTVQPPSAPTTTAQSAGDGVSRSHRSPKVRHQINQIHREHEDSVKKGTTSNTARTPSGQVHKTPTRKTGPARRG